MNRTYELWDVETGNIIGEFPTEDAGLAVVQALLDDFGTEYALALSLTRREQNKPATTVASGERLIGHSRNLLNSE